MTLVDGAGHVHRLALMLIVSALIPAFARAAQPVEVALSPDVISALPRVVATGKVHDTDMRCEGVSLVDLLRKSNAMPAEPLRGKQLGAVVVIESRDGYRVAFTLGELEPTLGNQVVVLADQCNGKPLSAEDGPWRLAVPGDTRAARWARQVQRVRVMDVP